MITVKKITVGSILLFLFFVTSSFFQNEGAPANSSRNINDHIYSQDSIQLLEYWDLYWRYDNNDLHDSAIYVCNKMISLGQELIPFRYDSVLFERYAKAYGGLGYHYMKLGDYDTALNYSFQSYDSLRSRFGENHIRITEVLVGVSMNYSARGDYDLALKYIFKSLKIMHQIFPDNHHYFGNNYMNLGEIYRSAGEYDKAIQWFERAEKSHKKAKRPGSENGVVFPQAMLELAEIYLLKNEEGKAEEIIRDCKVQNKLAKGSDMYFTQADYWLARTFIQTGQLEKSKQFFNKFLDKANTYPEIREDSPTEGDGFFGLAQIAEMQNDFEEALLLYEKAINSWIRHYGSGGRDKIINGFHQMGNIFLEQNKLDKALNSYHEALGHLNPSVSKKDVHYIPSMDELTPSVLGLETIGLKTTCLSRAYKNSDKSENLNEILASAELFIDMAIRLQENYYWDHSKFNIIKKIRPISELYLSIGDRLYRKSRKEEFLENMYSIVQKSKAIILQDKIKEIKAKNIADIPQAYRGRERRLKAELAEYEKKIFERERLGVRIDKEELVDLNNGALELKLELDALYLDLVKDYPEYSSSKSQEIFTTIPSLKKKLEPQNGVIEYFLGDSNLYIFTITKQETYFSCHPIEADFRKKIIDFRSIFQTYKPGVKKEAEIKNNYNLFVNNGTYLYEKLLKGILPKIKVNKIVIIPDGELNYLPFHILLTQKPSPGLNENYSYRNLSYLFLQKNIRYEYSASFVHLENSVSSAHNTYAGFAPEYGGDLLEARGYPGEKSFNDINSSYSINAIGKLLYNEPEIRNGAEITGGKAYFGNEGIESRFKEEAGDNLILHLAGHYLINEEAPVYSVFLFGQEKDTLEDGKLFVYELYNMQLNASLALLSGCDTGSGNLQEGEGILSLARAFKAAGCSSIVMSQWKADDHSCSLLMTAFLENLKEGKDKDIALKEARQSYLDFASDENTHPFYWANFLLIGDDDPINFKHGRVWLYSVLGLIFLTTFIWQLKRQKRPGY